VWEVVDSCFGGIECIFPWRKIARSETRRPFDFLVDAVFRKQKEGHSLSNHGKKTEKKRKDLHDDDEEDDNEEGDDVIENLNDDNDDDDGDDDDNLGALVANIMTFANDESFNAAIAQLVELLIQRRQRERSSKRRKPDVNQEKEE
jgi:hypothetical protein